MTCKNCGSAEFKKKYTDVAKRFNGYFYIIKEVPLFFCGNCGFKEDSQLKRLKTIIENRDFTEIEEEEAQIVPIINYRTLI